MHHVYSIKGPSRTAQEFFILTFITLVSNPRIYILLQQHISRYFQHAQLITVYSSGCGKERRILIGPWVTCQASTRSELP